MLAQSSKTQLKIYFQRAKSNSRISSGGSGCWVIYHLCARKSRFCGWEFKVDRAAGVAASRPSYSNYRADGYKPFASNIYRRRQRDKVSSVYSQTHCRLMGRRESHLDIQYNRSSKSTTQKIRKTEHREGTESTHTATALRRLLWLTLAFSNQPSYRAKQIE